MFNLPLLPPSTYVLCMGMCVCYGFSACICPFCSFDLARPRSRFSFTHTLTHMRAVCGYNFSIIVEFLLIFFFCFCFFISFSHRSPLIFCGVCGCLPRQRLECNLCSLAKCWAFAAAAASDCASLLASRISFYAHPHLLPLVICVIYAYRNKQTRPSHAKPSV